ncbi:hypothetical protein BDV95DRAFT_597746 [Massariosphaeria phaeospora]|uniref:Zn(2)-C6 fungal-type domain-containing protein n=1 Tax=Massariosphaeria phaeospora TaxID=100035 RepID=A0A7C8I8R4_9PLEO|nr:hypothetical protein BDV95DRAFT_597746 [Massariosphaeria phaeospora]
MLGYISSTRKKSCHACVRSKRRCDLGYPCCNRCFTKGLDCTYPNPVQEAQVVFRQATPDLVPASNVNSTKVLQSSSNVSQSSSNSDSSLYQISGSSSPESDLACHDRFPSSHTNILEGFLPQVWEPIILNERQISYLVKKLSSFIPSIAFVGHTPFLHEDLYKEQPFQSYQDSCSLSALYLMKTDKNIPILVNSINTKIDSLITSSAGWSLREHLAAVQALVVYQIIRLFDPDLQQQAFAAKQNGLLELWTAHLWKRSFNEASQFRKCYENWAFYESIRRTVIMSTMVRGAWSSLTQNGLCDQVPVLARLPWTKNASFFHLENLSEFMVSGPCTQQEGGLITYGDYSLKWNPGDDVNRLTSFERMLLSACRGKEDPDLMND